MHRRYYSISELTREFGVSTRTLRFYEDEGLLQPERRGRTRLYSESERLLLKDILRSRRVGLSVSEIKNILTLFHCLPGEPNDLKKRMSEIKAWRESLRQKRRDIDEMLGALDHAEEVYLGRLAEIGVGT